MLTQLPSEIVDDILEYLPLSDIRLITALCSALRPRAQLRLFKGILITVKDDKVTPRYAELILRYPYLLQYASRLTVRRPRHQDLKEMWRKSESPTVFTSQLWSQIRTMYRLTHVLLELDCRDYGAALRALEGLGSAKEIHLDINDRLYADTSMSKSSLPARSLSFRSYDLSESTETLLLQKCSQSLRVLKLSISNPFTTSPIPFLPHLREFSLNSSFPHNNRDLTPWFSFFIKHPSLTHLFLDLNCTHSAPVPPNLLPNLCCLRAHPGIVERLTPGRPLHDISTEQPPYGAMLSFHPTCQSLVLSHTPITTLEIITRSHLSADMLINMINSLPKLQKFRLSTDYQVCHFPKSMPIPLTFFYKVPFCPRRSAPISG
jgi:hypothetical protein